jgi:hypothetical protein
MSRKAKILAQMSAMQKSFAAGHKNLLEGMKVTVDTADFLRSNLTYFACYPETRGHLMLILTYCIFVCVRKSVSVEKFFIPDPTRYRYR